MSMKAAGGSVSGRIMPMLGRFFSAVAVAITIGAIVPSSAESVLAQQKPKLRPLHIALANHSVSMTSIYIAKHLGIFEGYGYDARVLVLEPRAAIGALLSGDLDCYSAIGSTCLLYTSDAADER